MDAKQERKKNEDSFDPLRSIAIAAGAGMTLIVFIGIGVWIGLEWDAYFGTFPFGLMGFSLFGAVGGIISVIKQMLEK